MMGLFSSACSWVSSACSAVGSFLGGCASKIGGGIGSFAANILGPIIKGPSELELKIAEAIVKGVINIITDIAKALGIIKDENVEEMGAKATQEEARPRKDFASEKEYIEYLRQEIELDKKRLEVMPLSERLACQAVGTAIVARGIKEDTGMELSPEFLLAAEKAKLSAGEIMACIEKFKIADYKSLDVVKDYLQGKDLKGKGENVGGNLVEALQQANPGVNSDAAKDKLIDFCIKSRV